MWSQRVLKNYEQVINDTSKLRFVITSEYFAELRIVLGKGQNRWLGVNKQHFFKHDLPLVIISKYC